MYYKELFYQTVHENSFSSTSEAASQVNPQLIVLAGAGALPNKPLAYVSLASRKTHLHILNK